MAWLDRVMQRQNYNEVFNGKGHKAKIPWHTCTWKRQQLFWPNVILVAAVAWTYTLLFTMLRVKPRALRMWDECSTTEHIPGSSDCAQ